VLLEVGEIGNEHELDPDCVLRMVMIYKNHFNNTFLIANTMYCVGMIAHTSVSKTPQYWSVLSKCVIAALRYHQMDKMVLGNGVYALGNLAACATELKHLIAEASGMETILGTMRLHESDNILQANCLLAVAKVCRVPRFAPDEDFNVTSKVCVRHHPSSHDRICPGQIRGPNRAHRGAQVSEQAAAIQKDALELGAYRALLRGLALHPADAVLRRCFCEASQSLAEGNSLLSAEAPAADSAAAEGGEGGEEPALVPAEAGGGEELPEVEDPQSWLLATLVQRIVHMMGSDVHPVVEVRGGRAVPPDEQHGRDEMVAAYGARVAARPYASRPPRTQVACCGNATLTCSWAPSGSRADGAGAQHAQDGGDGFALPAPRA